MRPLYPNFRIKYFFGCCSKQGNTVNNTVADKPVFSALDEPSWSIVKNKRKS